MVAGSIEDAKRGVKLIWDIAGGVAEKIKPSAAHEALREPDRVFTARYYTNAVRHRQLISRTFQD